MSGKSQGIKTGATGLFWVNVILSDGTYKLCVAELIEQEKNTKLYRVWSNAEKVKENENWTTSQSKKGWVFIHLFEDEINEFFNP